MPAGPSAGSRMTCAEAIGKVIDSDKPAERDSSASVAPKEKEIAKTETPARVKPADTTVAKEIAKTVS